MEIWQRAKEQLLSAYRERSQKQPPEWLEEKREEFLSRFPPERLEELRGEALLSLVHGSAPREGLFYEIEFGQASAGFGSVAGGSALKFRVYRSAEGEWKKKGPGNAPVTCSEAEATRITEELMQGVVSGLHLADEFDLGSGSKEAWKRFQETVLQTAALPAAGADKAVLELGWAHKYLAIARPELFSFHHSKHPLAQHLIRLGQIPEEGRYLLDWQWRELRQSDPDLAALYPASLTWAAWEAFGSNTGYWRVGTDDGQTREDRWPSMCQGGYASIGGRQLGNLRELLEGFGGEAARDRIREVLEQQGADQNPSAVSHAANQIYNFFAQMNVGDRVAAMKGKRLLGVGVIDSEYEYMEGERQPHRRRVHWLQVNPTDWEGAPGLRTVVYDFARRYAQAAYVERLVASGNGATPPPPGPREITPLTELEARIQEVLERKDQVILFGPPGTGKTYHAHRTARELVSRELVSGQVWPSLSEAQRRDVERRITFCTFHPAYAYEDFIEGFRPVKTDGGPAFELLDGLFLEVCDRARNEPGCHHILIIDEINRGNVAAVMGELITLIESDKRDVLAVRLPLSRRSFTVPKNLWIIGTMNTADRSISLLDAALRRRFGFVELLPEPDRIASHIEELPLSSLLAEINARIRRHVTRNARELQVGHAYFMKAGGAIRSKQQLQHVLRDDVIPLLAEYCFENYGTLQAILGEELIDLDAQVPRHAVLGDPDALYAALLRLAASDPSRAMGIECAAPPAGEEMEDADGETGLPGVPAP